jgi:uncharacterized protein
MKNRISNPFITRGYVSPEYFCNRAAETNKLLRAVASKRNVTLISLRRMGKTGLLKHVKYLLEQKKHPPAVIYIDLMPTMNGNEMMNAMSSALVREIKDEKNFIEKLFTLLSSLRPKLSYNSLTGQPSIELSVASPAEIQSGLETLLHFFSKVKKELVLIFDEFQQISQYPEKNIEQVLRTIIQSHPGISFIFSGSSKHMLESMFGSAGRPFYQSADLMYLEEIPEPDYRNFIQEHFNAGNKKISADNLTTIFNFTRLHTFYVQHVCNLLYESGRKIIDAELINSTFYSVLNSFEPMYASFRNLIPSHQFMLLQALACENGTAQPMSSAFINTYKLVSASSVNTSLKALAAKEMIVQRNNLWLVYDVFFSRWLEYQYGRK